MKQTVKEKGWREVMRKKMLTSNTKSEGKPLECGSCLWWLLGADEDEMELSVQMVLLSISATSIPPEISRSISSCGETTAVYVELL